MFVNDCFQVLEFYKSTRKNLEDFSKRVDSKHFENAKMIYSIVKYLERYMSQAGLRTYTDQINDVLYFFERNQKYIPKFEHILVDEFQDVNSQQVKLLNLLDAPNYFYVGDPRQSIFGWRGSNVKYIWNLLKKGIEVINLRKNYRSNEHIVNLMNASILEFNLENLTTDIVGEREIKLCKFESENVEFEYVYKKILISKNKRNEIFVLARTNKQLENFSNFLKKMKIKHILKNEYSKNILPKEDEIVLSTIHSIKGLEAEEVYVIGCTRNNFPCRASEHPVMELVKMYDYDKDEEEKRLFYVAISRAKNKLYLTYSGKNCTFFINDKMKEHIDELNFDS
jgi:superfamily I DNA/RNA helicase